MTNSDFEIEFRRRDILSEKMLRILGKLCKSCLAPGLTLLAERAAIYVALQTLYSSGRYDRRSPIEPSFLCDVTPTLN